MLYDLNNTRADYDPESMTWFGDAFNPETDCISNAVIQKYGNKFGDEISKIESPTGEIVWVHSDFCNDSTFVGEIVMVMNLDRSKNYSIVTNGFDDLGNSRFVISSLSDNISWVGNPDGKMGDKTNWSDLPLSASSEYKFSKDSNISFVEKEIIQFYGEYTKEFIDNNRDYMRSIASGFVGHASMYYRAVAGTNGLNWSRVGNWSNSSGGGSNGSVPTIATDCIFDANSGSCTLQALAQYDCNSVDFTNYPATKTFNNLGKIFNVVTNFTSPTATSVFANSGTVRIGGNFSCAGTWTNSNGTIRMTTAAAGTSTWNASITTSYLRWMQPNTTITVTAGNTITVSSELNINGNATNNITVQSSTTSAFTVDLGASIAVKSLSHASLTYMDLGTGDTLVGLYCTLSNCDADITTANADKAITGTNNWADAVWTDAAGNPNQAAPTAGQSYFIAAGTCTVAANPAAIPGNGFIGGTLSLAAGITFTSAAASTITVESGGTFLFPDGAGSLVGDTGTATELVSVAGTLTCGTDTKVGNVCLCSPFSIASGKKLTLLDSNVDSDHGFTVDSGGELDDGGYDLYLVTGTFTCNGTFTSTGKIIAEGNCAITGTGLNGASSYVNNLTILSGARCGLLSDGSNVIKVAGALVIPSDGVLACYASTIFAGTSGHSINTASTTYFYSAVGGSSSYSTHSSITWGNVYCGLSPDEIIYTTDQTIAGNMTIATGDIVTLDCTSNDVALIFTGTSGPTLTLTDNDSLRATNNTGSYSAEIIGNSTNKIIIQTGYVNFDYTGSGEKWNLDKVQFNVTQATGGNHTHVTQTGDVLVATSYYLTVTAADDWAVVSYRLDCDYANANCLIISGTMTVTTGQILPDGRVLINSGGAFGSNSAYTLTCSWTAGTNIDCSGTINTPTGSFTTNDRCDFRSTGTFNIYGDWTWGAYECINYVEKDLILNTVNGNAIEVFQGFRCDVGTSTVTMDAWNGTGFGYLYASAGGHTLVINIVAGSTNNVIIAGIVSGSTLTLSSTTTSHITFSSAQKWGYYGGGTLNIAYMTFSAALDTSNGGSASPTITQTGAVTCSSTLKVASGDTWTTGDNNLTLGNTFANSGTVNTGTGTISGTSGAKACTGTAWTLGASKTLSIEFVDLQFDLTTGGSARNLTVTNNVTVDAITVSAGDALTCNTSSSAITISGNNAKAIIGYGAISMTGTAPYGVTISEPDYVMARGTSASISLTYVTITAAVGEPNFRLYLGQYTSADALVSATLSNLTLTGSATAGGLAVSTATQIVMTNSSITGGDASTYEKCTVLLRTTTSNVCLFDSTFTTIGLFATSAWLVSKVTNGADFDFTVYGVLGSESAAATYRAANITGSLTTKQATAYSSSYATTYTLGANAADVNSCTVDSGTVLAVSRDLEVSGATSVSGTLTCNNSTVALGSGWNTNTYSATIESGGSVTTGGTITIGAFAILDGSSFVSTGTLIINGRNTHKGYNVGLVTDFICSGTFTVNIVQINYAGSSNISMNALSPPSLGELTIKSGTTGYIDVGSSASYSATMVTLTVENAAIFTTYNTISTNISVSGATSVVGTLYTNGSTVSCGATTVTGTMAGAAGPTAPSGAQTFTSSLAIPTGGAVYVTTGTTTYGTTISGAGTLNASSGGTITGPSESTQATAISGSGGWLTVSASKQTTFTRRTWLITCILSGYFYQDQVVLDGCNVSAAIFMKKSRKGMRRNMIAGA